MSTGILYEKYTVSSKFETSKSAITVSDIKYFWGLSKVEASATTSSCLVGVYTNSATVADVKVAIYTPIIYEFSVA